VRDWVNDHCHKCGAFIPCPKDRKRAYHDATSCTAKTENSTDAEGGGQVDEKGGSGGGGRERTVDFAVADAVVGVPP
jgi:hypothetical protein